MDCLALQGLATWFIALCPLTVYAGSTGFLASEITHAPVRLTRRVLDADSLFRLNSKVCVESLVESTLCLCVCGGIAFGLGAAHLLDVGLEDVVSDALLRNLVGEANALACAQLLDLLLASSLCALAEQTLAGLVALDDSLLKFARRFDSVGIGDKLLRNVTRLWVVDPVRLLHSKAVGGFLQVRVVRDVVLVAVVGRSNALAFGRNEKFACLVFDALFPIGTESLLLQVGRDAL